MPNWAYTSVRVQGDSLQLESLYNLMKSLQDLRCAQKPGHFGNTWYGYLVGALGASWKEISCRGSWDSVDYAPGQDLTWYSEDAWSACVEVFALIEAKFPKLKVLYSSEEGGCEYYATNNPDERDAYLVECSDNERLVSEYCETLRECYEYISNEYQTRIEDEDDIDDLREKLAETDENSYINIHEFEFIELPTLSDDILKEL